jgi:hypothetical protein
MTDQPSPLAIKLAARFHPKGPDAAAQVQSVLDSHQCDEWERKRAENARQPRFADNIWVKRARAPSYVAEWLTLSLAPAEDDHPYRVQLRRYCTPGRIATYSFDMQIAACAGVGPRFRYYSEPWCPIAKAIQMAQVDLDRPQVVALCVKAFEVECIVRAYGHEFIWLLDILAPKSRTYRAVKRVCDQTMEARATRLKTSKP